MEGEQEPKASASPYFLSALVTFLRALSQNKARFSLFYLFYNIALLTFVKKLALICIGNHTVSSSIWN